MRICDINITNLMLIYKYANGKRVKNNENIV